MNDVHDGGGVNTLADLGFFLEGVTLGTNASEASEHWGSGLKGE